MSDNLGFFRPSWARLCGCVRVAAALSLVTALSSCGGDHGSSSYALNVYVTGLTGSGLRVALNGGAPILISGNSQTTVAHLTNGTAYAIAINAQPVTPAQICSAANPSGKISGNNVDVMINCVAAEIAVPVPPSNVLATSGNSQIVLNWIASPGATSYSVYQGPTPGGESTTPVASGLSNPTATLTGLMNGAIYFYTVTAVNAGGVSPSSMEIAAAPAAAPVAKGQLASGALVLTDAQNGQIVSETASLVTVNGALSIAPGTVFLTADNAYIADGSASTNGQTLISVHPPQVDDVFSSLQISGTFPVTSNTVLPAAATFTSRATEMAAQPAASGAASGTLSQTFPISATVGGLAAKGSVTSALTVSINYDYRAGALQSSTVSVTQVNHASITASFTAGVAQQGDIPLATFRIPVSVTLVDGLLNAVGLRLASIQIPVSVFAKADLGFNASATLTGLSQATASVSYAAGGTPSATGTLSGTSGVSVDPSSVSTTGSAVLATVTANGSVYLHLRPAFAFLNQVALLGADVQAGPTAKLTAQILPETPPYCLQVDASLDGSVAAFFTTIGVKLTSDAAEMHKDFPPPAYFGSCRLATNIAATVNASSLPATYGQLVQIDVAVTPQSMSAAQGKTPSGTVTITMNASTCTATLSANGTGSCSLTADQAGAAIQYLATYSGDTTFSSSQNTTATDVARANTTIGVLAPSITSANSPTTFAVTVTANPAIVSSVSVAPTGDVNIVDAAGKTLCVANLDASLTGTGSCSAVFTKLGAALLNANYSGDTNYSPSTSSFTVTVVPQALLLQITPSAPSVAIGATVTLAVSATDVSGNAVPTPPNLQWTSSDPTIAAVSGGVVTGVGSGSATITVTDPASTASVGVVVAVGSAAQFVGTWSGPYDYSEINGSSGAPGPKGTLTLTIVAVANGQLLVSGDTVRAALWGASSTWQTNSVSPITNAFNSSQPITFLNLVGSQLDYSNINISILCNAVALVGPPCVDPVLTKQ